MADLLFLWCDRCQVTQPHVKFVAGKEVLYVCDICKHVSVGKTLEDLMEGARIR